MLERPNSERSEPGINDRGSRLLPLGLLAAAVFVVAYASISLSEQAGPVSALWPTNGVVLAYILRRPLSEWLLGLGVSFVASYSAYASLASPTLAVAILPLCDTLEVGLAALAMRALFGNGTAEIYRTRQLIGFLIICGLIVPFLVTATAAALLSGSLGLELLAIIRNWFLSDSLGILAIAPGLVTVRRKDIAWLVARTNIARSAGALLFSVTVTALVFSQDEYQIAFVAFSGLVPCALYLGFSGAALANLMTGVIATSLTMNGHGPFSGVAMDETDRILLAQFFVATAVLTTLPMTSVLSERRRLQEQAVAAWENADRADRAKTDFLANMSHELRTPMNAIIGFADLMLSMPKDPLTPRQAEYARHILTSGRHLTGLIQDILDVTKADASALSVRIEPTDLVTLIAETCDTLEATAQRKQVRLIRLAGFESSCPVMADSVRLRQVLLNLVSNAIKYNRPQGEVRLKIETAETPNWIRLCVEDTGIGIAADRRDEVFRPFNRLGAEKTAVEGTGIGLSISKQLIELMEGRIGFDSVADQGSQFWFELPRAPDISV